MRINEISSAVNISRLPAVVKADILDMCLGPNGPSSLREYWLDTYGVMSFNETYLAQALFGFENLNRTSDDGVVEVSYVTVKIDELYNPNRSISGFITDRYSKLATEAPPVLVRRDSSGWKLVEGGNRTAAAKIRGNEFIRAIDVSAFFGPVDWEALLW